LILPIKMSQYDGQQTYINLFYITNIGYFIDDQLKELFPKQSDTA